MDEPTVTVKGKTYDLEEETARTLSTLTYNDLIEMLLNYMSDEDKKDWIEAWHRDD